MAIDDARAAELAGSLLGQAGLRASAFGAGKFSQAFRVRGDGECYVLRVAPPDSLLQLFYEYRMMRQEPAIHRRLLAETSVPVPPILAYDFSRRRIDRDFLVMPLLPGTPMSSAALSGAARRRVLSRLGDCVRQVHALTDPDGRFGYLGEHHCMEPQPTWRDAFALMYRKLLADVVACGVYAADQGDAAMRLLQAHRDVFDGPEESHLLHGDLWAANLLVGDDAELTGLLDFDRACWGDVEWDLAIAEYCGLTGEAFWAGYGRRVETHAGPAAVRRLFYLLYEHQKYIVISMSARRNDPARARRYAAECLAVMEGFRRTGVPAF